MPGDRFNRFAKIYDQIIHPKENSSWKAHLNFHPQKIIIDLGGGTGRNVPIFTDACEIIILADHSFAMLQQSRFRDLQNTRFVCCDLNNLPFMKNLPMNMVMVDTLHHIYEPEKVLFSLLERLQYNCVFIIEEPDISFFYIKLIAFGERLLGMKSHFFKKEKIISWFNKGDYHVLTEQEGNNYLLILERIQQKEP